MVINLFSWEEVAILTICQLSSALCHSTSPCLWFILCDPFHYRIRPCWAKPCSVSTHPAKKARTWTLRSSRGWWSQLAPLPSCALTTLSILRSQSCPRWKQVNLAWMDVVLKSASYTFYTLSPLYCSHWPLTDFMLRTRDFALLSLYLMEGLWR